MNKITSRKNEWIQTLRQYRGPDFLCCGTKMLAEALRSGAEITALFFREGKVGEELCADTFELPGDLFDYVCPQKNSPGPLFIARKAPARDREVRSAVILENVQDPGNVGTVLRTANAMDIDCVYLVGACASLTNPKTVQASMGAVFYQRVETDCLPDLPIVGAALSDLAVPVTEADLSGCAVAIGSEGSGLSEELLQRCAQTVIIPMSERAESLNAAVAAGILMWEMRRGKNFVDR